MTRSLWLLLVALVIGAGGATYYYLGHGKETIRNVAAGVAVQSKIEKVTEEAATTGVDVKGVKVALDSGEGSVAGVTVDNPKGFSDEPAMELGAVQFELDPASIDGNGPLIIRSLAINAAKIRYDVGSGSSNLEALTRSATAAAEKALSGASAQTGGKVLGTKALGGRLVMIDNLYVRNIKLLSDKTKPEAAPELARIHLSNIGRAENGVPPSAAASVS